MTTIISDSYYSFFDTLNSMNNLKLKDHPGGWVGVADGMNAILVNLESLDSSGAFNP